MPPTTRNQRSRGSIAATVLAGLTAVAAVHAQDALVRFAIPAQPLASGLLALGRQARISIAAPTGLVAGKTGRAVRGDLTVRAALDRMLDGTGLGYEFVGAGAVRIRAGGKRSSGLARDPAAERPSFQQS